MHPTLTIKSCYKLSDQDVLKAVFTDGHADYHGYFIRVHRLGDLHLQAATNDPDGRFDMLCELDPGGMFETTKVAGFEGDYVLVITPFQT